MAKSVAALLAKEGQLCEIVHGIPPVKAIHINRTGIPIVMYDEIADMKIIVQKTVGGVIQPRQMLIDER